jgi:hypothetical protein
VFLALFGLITHAHFGDSGDASHYLMIAHSLAFHGDLDMTNDYRDSGNLLTRGDMVAGDHIQPGRGGLRPVHDVGMPLVWLPYYALAYRIADRVTDTLPEALRRAARLDRFIMLRQLVCLSMIALTSGLAVLFFELASSLSGKPLAAWLGALLWTLSPPLLTHGYVFFTEVPSALLALASYALLRRGPEAGAARLALAGALAGYLPLVHVRNIGLALGLSALAAWRLWRERRSLLAFAAPFLLGLCARTGLTHELWGTWLTTPHASFAPWEGVFPLIREVATRSLGLLFDQEHGLLPAAPLYLLCPLGFWLLRRQAARDAQALAFLCAAYLAPVLWPAVNPHGWQGGWSPAARFLVPIAPLLGLPLVIALADTRLRALTFPLVAVQCLLNGYFWSHPKLTWARGSGAAPFLEALGGPGAVRLFPSWPRSALEAFAISAVALLAWAFLIRWGLKLTRDVSEPARARG